VWVTAWPTPTRRMSNIQLAVHAAWHMGVQVGLLQPMIGQKLWKAGANRGPADGHGIGIACSNTDRALRTCHNQPCAALEHRIAREARLAGVHVMAEVFGAFTRALRDADLEISRFRDFEISGRCSHGGAEARREQREVTTTRHKGQLACPVLLPVC
jgi:hypothetical protein